VITELFPEQDEDEDEELTDDRLADELSILDKSADFIREHSREAFDQLAQEATRQAQEATRQAQEQAKGHERLMTMTSQERGQMTFQEVPPPDSPSEELLEDMSLFIDDYGLAEFGYLLGGI